MPSPTKKRKISATKSVAGEEPKQDLYGHYELEFKTLRQDLKEIPHEILLEAVARIAEENLQTIIDINDALFYAVQDANQAIKNPKPVEKVDAGTKKAAGKAQKAKIEAREYSPEKLQKKIQDLFACNTWFISQCSFHYFRRQIEERKSSFEKVFQKLDHWKEKALQYAQVGEHATAYILLRVLHEEATLNKFETNGDMDYLEVEDDMEPKYWVEGVKEDLDDEWKELSKKEQAYCKQKLKMYEAEKPVEANNTSVIAKYPLNSQQVKREFSLYYDRCEFYIGRFDLTSTSKTTEKGVLYEIRGQVDAVSMGGFYTLTVTFDDKGLQNYTCSCPMGSTIRSCCKHTSAFMAQIAQEKEKQIQNSPAKPAIATKTPKSTTKTIKRSSSKKVIVIDE